MKYMLDTNIIIYTINTRKESTLREFMKHSPGEMCISAITMAELEYGICNSTKPAQNRFALLGFLTGIEVMPFDSNAAEEYGLIRYDLKTKGTSIGNNDMLIAAHARSLNVTLVTNNTKEFKRVPELQLESW